MSESRSDSSGLRLRRATEVDAPALARLARATFDEAFGHMYAANDLAAFLEGEKSEVAYATLLARDDILAVIAETPEGRPAGYVLAGDCKLPVDDLSPLAGEVRELYVLTRHQGHRLGTRLLDAALDWLEKRRRSPLYVGVWSGNDGAQRLYARYGFHKVGEYDFPVGTHIDREFILQR